LLSALAELARRFPGRFSLMQAACEAADLPPLLLRGFASGDEDRRGPARGEHEVRYATDGTLQTLSQAI
jgi:hypothetical protein